MTEDGSGAEGRDHSLRILDVRSFACTCGCTVFFENTRCTGCGSELGWCPACLGMTPLLPEGGAQWRCGRPGCAAALVKCHNYAVEQVCNRCCMASEAPVHPAPLCDYCRFNHTIPDLSVPGNREKWHRLEAAKRRLLYALDLLDLPYGTEADGVWPPLSFDFMADVPGGSWWPMGEQERARTGYMHGRITLNIAEADAVEREKARVDFQEAHRTLIGHFRHEIGHYYWEMLVQQRCERDFAAVFGDHAGLSYAEAKRRYYEQGPAPGWQATHISAYATMHPWEDFAETFAAYLDMVSVLDTAFHADVFAGSDPTREPLATMLDEYVRLGLVVNEMNRAMGLMDLVPEVFTTATTGKLEFVHGLVRRSAERRSRPPLAPPS